jgi:hypothetical protein
VIRVVRHFYHMAGLYQTEVWQMRLPEQWHVREEDGHAHVTVFRSDGVGLLEIMVTDDAPTAWREEGDDFRGQVFGKTSLLTFNDRFCRWWTLFCGGVSLYVTYRCAAHESDLERLEIDDIVNSLSAVAEPNDPPNDGPATPVENSDASGGGRHR